MIAPNMATMLGVILTDAPLAPSRAQTILQAGVDESFNCIRVDGHTSTSDAVLLLANGQSGEDVDVGSMTGDVPRAVAEVCRDLAQAIIRDAEGASHFVTVKVRGCPDRAAAAQAARAVCDSPLVKTAVAGNDPNWGRIVSAAGYSGTPFDPREASLSLNGTEIFAAGQPLPFDEAALSQRMATGEVEIDLVLGRGPGEVTFWTSDLTAEYVRLNADYTT